jgi:hypothetical protein
MTPRSIFLIILKVVGLFLLKEALVCAYQTLLFAVTVASSTPTGGGSSTASMNFSWAGLAAMFLGYLSLSLLFLFKTPWIVDLLKLDRGFDQ